MRPQFDGGKLVTTLDAGPFVAPNARVASCAASAAGDEVALVLTDGGLALLYPP
jgi:hypothetical protein